MQRSSNGRRGGQTLAIVLLILGGLISFGIVAGVYADQGRTARKRHTGKVDGMKRGLKQESQKRKRQWKAKLYRTLGGGSAAIASDPDLTVAQMISGIAKSAAGKGPKIEVKARYFTELDVTSTKRRPDNSWQGAFSASDAARMAKEILAHGSKYVNSIRFESERHGSKQLDFLIDKRAIDERADWATATAGHVRAALKRQ